MNSIVKTTWIYAWIGERIEMEMLIEPHKKGDVFICQGCNKEKKYYQSGLCSSCYKMNLYYTNEKYRLNCIRAMNRYRETDRYKLKSASDKIGNMDNIEKLCLEHGFSPDVAEAIAMDGVILDKKMKEKGIIQ